MAVRLDVDGNLVLLGRADHAAVDATHHVERLALGDSLGSEAVVGGVETRAAGELGPAHGVQDIFDAQRGAFGQRDGECGVDLGKRDAEPVHFAAHFERVLPQRNVRLVPEPVNPTDAVDGAALDESEAVAVTPFEALVEVPVTGVECIRMKADFDHTGTSLSGKQRSTSWGGTPVLRPTSTSACANGKSGSWRTRAG